MLRLCIIIGYILILFPACPVPAQIFPSTTAALVPVATYDPAIPTLKEMVGHDFGDEITTPTDIVRYIKALAEAAPGRTRLVQYGETWEGRPLYMLAIASPERISALDSIKEDLQRLADPRTISAQEAEQLIEKLPVVSVMMHAVHGAEISPSGAAMAEAYHLLAAQNDPAVDLILKESIVLIDPCLNPDGRARIISNNLEARAKSPDPYPLAAEHDEPWPGGRVNHYLFDMNRDWFAHTQRETRARVQFIQTWAPHVMGDLHEMGSKESTYFFPPPAPSDNPYLSDGQHRIFEAIGRSIAGRFDERGYAYFTREGYRAGRNPNGGSSWPLAHGILGMLFEMTTPISLVHRRTDGSLLTYRDGVLRHFTAAMATLETAARHRQEILKNYHAYRQQAIATGRAGAVKAYVLPPGSDPGQTRRLAQMLVRNGIEVFEISETMTYRQQTLPAGSFFIPLAQPAGRVVQNLMDRQATWNPALLFDAEYIEMDRMPDVAWQQVAASFESPTTVLLPPAKVAYLLPWNPTTAATVAEALQAGIRVRAGRAPLVIAGRRYESGIAVIRTADNGDDLRSTLSEIAHRHNADITAVDTGFPDDGVSLGSDRIKPLKAPRVLLGWDAPAFKYSAGWTRYILEQRYGQPVTVVRINTLRRVNYHDFDVIILPSASASYSELLGETAVQRLKDWTANGGTLITLGEASRWAANEAGMIDMPVSLPLGQAEGYADAVSRTLLRVELNRNHWLATGTDGEMQMLSSARCIFTPTGEGNAIAAGVYADGPSLIVGGNLSESVRNTLAENPVIAHQPQGRGRIVAFLEEPNGFGYAEATAFLFMNAVLLGPGNLP